MSRDLSGTQIRSATDIDGSYQILAKADVYPSRIFFSSVTDPHPVAGADATGIVDSPMKQDIIYNAIMGGLVTFWCDTELRYAVQGDSTIHDLTVGGTTCKPGVFGSSIFFEAAAHITRWGLDWGNPITLTGPDLTLGLLNPPVAMHAVGDTECIVIEDDDGGFRAEYVAGITAFPISSKSRCRFMFPSLMPYDKSSLTMEQQGLASGAAKLGNKVFAYVSNASTGCVEGMYYDLDNGDWSDIFVAVPTDLDVSLCSFKIANVYEHNGTIYMCGQFSRSDSMNVTDEPYSLLLYSTDGKTFSVDRFVLVSNLGYRFLATVANNQLYLGNCNRVCYDDVTWVFDGDTGTNGKVLHLTRSDIKSISDQSLERLNMVLIAGKEEYFDSTYIVPEARVVLWLGLTTFVPASPPITGADEYVVFGTYIIDNITNNLQSGIRSTQVDATGEAQWKLSGLSMPFYAEILGKSVHHDPLLTDTTELSPAGNVYLPLNYFGIDMWNHVGWDSTDTTPDTVGINMHAGGGVDYYVATAAPHSYGIITDSEIQTILGLATNPKITATSIDVNIWGWSHPLVIGQLNDLIGLVLVTADEEGVETTWWPGCVGNLDNGRWHESWPEYVAHESPIAIHVTGLTIGHTIKKCGVVFWASNITWFNIARLEFVAGVQVQYTFYDADSTWDMDADENWKVPRQGRPFIMYAQRPYNTHTWSVSGSFKNTVSSGNCIAGYPVGYGLVGFGSDNDNYIVGRYNVTTTHYEIVLVRDGVETLLANSAWALSQGYPILRFEYSGGRFNLYYLDVYHFEPILTYEWKVTDGLMFIDRLESMKCGIYGSIGVPYARTLGYYPGESEGITNADGLAIDPVFALTDWPNTGSLRIGDDIYSYTWKRPFPAKCRGPYRFCTQSTAFTYGPAGSGLDCNDFYWIGGAADLNGYLVAMDDGASFVISNTYWQVQEDAVPNYYHSRVRFYSANDQIAKAYHTTGAKVWVTGGFGTLVQTNGSTVVSKHSEGEMCNLQIPGEIHCYWYSGAGGEDDTVVEDMIDRVCRLSGVTPVFPGDLIVPLITLIPNPPPIITIPYAEGIDFSYEQDVNWGGECVWYLDVKIDPEYIHWEPPHSDALKAAILNDTSILIQIIGGLNPVGELCDCSLGIYSEPSNELVYYEWIRDLRRDGDKWRIVLFGGNISFYTDGRWLFTKAFYKLIYGTSLTLQWSGLGDVTNMRVKELGDWREAIYLDLETDGQSAINSVIQQRLVEANGLPDGTIQFYMDITRPQITAVRAPRTQKLVHTVPIDGASDAIIYGPLDVKTMQNADFAKDLGFATKLFRMPDLTIGATRAAQLILAKSYQSRYKYDLTIRPDLELMVGDEYEISYTASGTGRVESHTIIVEGIATNVRMSSTSLASSQEVYGRES